MTLAEGGPLTAKGQRQDDRHVNEEVLDISQVAQNLEREGKGSHHPRTSPHLRAGGSPNPQAHRVEKQDAEILDDAIERHEFEDAEGGDQGSSALPGGGGNRERDLQGGAEKASPSTWDGSSPGGGLV